jgi:hypothetical protein
MARHRQAHARLPSPHGQGILEPVQTEPEEAILHAQRLRCDAPLPQHGSPASNYEQGRVDA